MKQKEKKINNFLPKITIVLEKGEYAIASEPFGEPKKHSLERLQDLN